MFATINSPSGAYEIPAPTGPPPLTNADMVVSYGSQNVAGNSLDLTDLKAHALTTINAELVAQGKTPLASLPAYLDTLLTQRFDPANSIGLFSSGGTVATAQVHNGSAGITGGTVGGTVSTRFQLELNQEDPSGLHMSQYISRAEKIRVLYWRDVLP